MVEELLAGTGQDTLVLVEHPATVTLGRRAGDRDLRCPEIDFVHQGVALHRINRGGLATAHEPGQLVAYPVMALKIRDLRRFTQDFLLVVVDLLAEYGIVGELKSGNPGVWVGDRKICSFGIALKRWISSHGIALNLNNPLRTFDLIVPCGEPTQQITSLSHELGHPVDVDLVKQQFVERFCRVFGYFPAD